MIAIPTDDYWMTDLVRTLAHGRPSPVARDDAFAAVLGERFGGAWDAWVDHSRPGEVAIYIAGPGGTATVDGTWLDALDVDRWERRQIDAARSVHIRSPLAKQAPPHSPRHH